MMCEKKKKIEQRRKRREEIDFEEQIQNDEASAPNMKEKVRKQEIRWKILNLPGAHMVRWIDCVGTQGKQHCAKDRSNLYEEEHYLITFYILKRTSILLITEITIIWKKKHPHHHVSSCIIMQKQ